MLTVDDYGRIRLEDPSPPTAGRDRSHPACVPASPESEPDRRLPDRGSSGDRARKLFTAARQPNLIYCASTYSSTQSLVRAEGLMLFVTA